MFNFKKISLVCLGLALVFLLSNFRYAYAKDSKAYQIIKKFSKGYTQEEYEKISTEEEAAGFFDKKLSQKSIKIEKRYTKKENIPFAVIYEEFQANTSLAFGYIDLNFEGSWWTGMLKQVDEVIYEESTGLYLASFEGILNRI